MNPKPQKTNLKPPRKPVVEIQDLVPQKKVKGGGVPVGDEVKPVVKPSVGGG